MAVSESDGASWNFVIRFGSSLQSRSTTIFHLKPHLRTFGGKHRVGFLAESNRFFVHTFCITGLGIAPSRSLGSLGALIGVISRSENTISLAISTVNPGSLEMQDAIADTYPEDATIDTFHVSSIYFHILSCGQVVNPPDSASLLVS